MGYAIPHPKKRAFLSALSTCGNISEAARIAEVDRTSHYEWLKTDEVYKAAAEDAIETACDLLEQEARRRAVEGVEEPIIRDGAVVGTVRRYSDTLLIFLLNGARPKKYRANYIKPQDADDHEKVRHEIEIVHKP